MLDYKILSNKSKINLNGTTIYDLLSGRFSMEEIGVGRMLMVNKYYVARPDLISLAVYGTDEYADIICKVNGISNPFEMNEDDLLFLPEIDFIRAISQRNTGPTNELVSDNNGEIVPKKSNFQKLYNDTRTPNQQLVGDQNFVIDKSLGLIFY